LIEDLKVKRERISVIYNGIDKQDFPHNKIKSKGDYGFRENDYLIGMLGRISEEKGHFLAVEATKLLSMKYDNLYLLFAGQGRLRKRLEVLLEETGMNKVVKFVDLQAQDFLDVIDLLIIPSKREGFGYSILEAFIKETPVVGFNTGGIAEIIKDRENGLLFFEYDPLSLKKVIEEIMVNQELRKKVIKGAKETLLNFTLERMVANTQKVYEKI
jgi:glycosyltransferase involved in cell wall biosynthesis